MTESKNVVFNFGEHEDSDKEEKDEEKSNKNNTTNLNNNANTDNLSESEAKQSHIDKIDMYDRLNFKRIAFKRSSRKGKTEMVSLKKFNIEKFTEEITRIVEEIRLPAVNTVTPPLREKERKKTIRFDNKRTTYKYPKERQLIEDHHTIFDKDTEHASEEETEIDVKVNDMKLEGEIKEENED